MERGTGPGYLGSRLLGRGESGLDEMIRVIREVCPLPGEDGLAFLTESVVAEEIRIPDEYGGVRVRLEARLAAARLPVQIDIGFVDAVMPPPLRVRFPVLLDLPAPEILVYPKETVVAEKFKAMVSKGVTNTRMKDFYDIDYLARTSDFQGKILVEAIQATFRRRGYAAPLEEPMALQPGFLIAPLRASAWKAFLRRGRLGRGLEPEAIHTRLRNFLVPVWRAAAEGTAFDIRWPVGGPWTSPVGGESA